MNITFLDIETTPNLAWVWDKYEQDVIAYARERYLLSFSYRRLGEKTVHSKSLKDYPSFTRVQRRIASLKLKLPDNQMAALGHLLHDDEELVKDLLKVYNESDIVVAHNGDNFDVRMSNAFFIRHHLNPPPPGKTVDTKKVAKQKFRFNSNRLDDLGEYLGLGRKLSTGGFSLWLGCLRGSRRAFAQMVKYNDQDVVLLEKVYQALLPWMTTHPNVNVLDGRPDACPKCGSAHIQSRGTGCNKTRTYQRFVCLDCHGWFRSLATEKSGINTT